MRAPGTSTTKLSNAQSALTPLGQRSLLLSPRCPRTLNRGMARGILTTDNPTEIRTTEIANCASLRLTFGQNGSIKGLLRSPTEVE